MVASAYSSGALTDLGKRSAARRDLVRFAHLKVDSIPSSSQYVYISLLLFARPFDSVIFGRPQFFDDEID